MSIPSWPIPGVTVRRRTRSVFVNASPVPRVAARPRVDGSLLRLRPKSVSRAPNLRPGTSMPS
jgi:hypothetical protein